MSIHPVRVCFRLTLADACLSFLLVCLLTAEAGAQTSSTGDITGITTTTTAGTPSSTTFPAATGSTLTGGPYTINYSGQTMVINSFTSGATTYTPLNYVGTVTTTLERSGNVPNNNVIYHQISSQPDANTYNVVGSNIGTEQAAFNTNNLNNGTDNVFGNQGDPVDNNNVERIDVVFSNGLLATNALAFSVLERGNVNGHDAFKIAAITSIDGSGNPTGFGSLISFASGSYGNTILGNNTTWLVLRNGTNDSGGNADNPSAVTGKQALGGVVISVTGAATNALGIIAGTTIYGYALFAGDTTDTGTLTDLSNTTEYPRNTNSTSSTSGGLDPVTYTGIAFTATSVPEPSQYGILLFLLMALFWLGRNLSRKPALAE